MSIVALVAADPAPVPASGPLQLVLAALIGIAVLVFLITKAKLHPFLSLTIGSLLVGGIAGLALDKTMESFSKGVGSTGKVTDSELLNELIFKIISM